MNRSLAAIALQFSLMAVLACGGEPAVDQNAEVSPAPEVENELSPSRRAGVGVGSSMPEYLGRSLDGQLYALSGRSDHVRLVNVWATWCGPCRHEIPELIAMQKRHGPNGLQIIGVSIDSAQAADQVRSFVKAKGINYTVVHDPDGKIVDLMATPVIPTSALIDRAGKIVWYHRGVVRAGDTELAKALEGAL